MKRILAVLLLTAGNMGSVAYAGIDVAAARQSLKNYGLGYCIVNQFKDESDVKSDIESAIGAYSFMGSGMHRILQNEDTLETLHNPYDATTDFVFSMYEETQASSKYTDKKVVFYACLDLYNSKAFDDFIKTQDPYITQ
ncbi:MULTISPECIES: hypothetical protein [Pseudomonas]|uniref:hypothetical protein n=1 Tax=Pseudomonas TaxID=286 RepID=UPI0006936BB8|nr:MULTISPECIES: hypothetical protein [Pseudomonas]AZD93812.1 hypothetical protein C4K13_4403 [Pseudomonas chlororaphis subsp. aureofaciens]AZE06215.1 hypothetical protein C4K11_4061 [Pseudomonas chlororaphis subsp. aureofaciens]KAA5840688.1 hypothetical protein F2A37_19995 [Pseudomonas chlororaphis]KAB0533853.1 hypothetical protein F7R16_07260 [Pseudomonas chlororaphis subsp. aureofaciens]MBP5063876.1 hypothetical protein [Pseudomonas chlororaphis]